MKKYQIIYADPPWEYWFPQNLWHRKQSRGQSHYPCMTLEEICNLPVKEISAEKAHLYLWTPSQQLGNGEAKKVCEAWGFEIKNILTWCKPQIGLGYYFRNSTEHIVFGVKGKMKTINKKQGTWFIYPRGKHSEKPPQIRDLIIKCSGDLPRIELFARKSKGQLFEDKSFKGWDVWGNEVESDIDL